MIIPRVKTAARRATLLNTGAGVTINTASNGRLILGGLPDDPPHPWVNTIRVEFQGQPEALPEPDHAAWLTAAPRVRPTGGPTSEPAAAIDRRGRNED